MRALEQQLREARDEGRIETVALRYGLVYGPEAEVFGAAPPRAAPTWLIRLLAPLLAAGLQARLPLSNAKARRELGWAPAHPSPRDGLRQVAGTVTSES